MRVAVICWSVPLGTLRVPLDRGRRELEEAASLSGVMSWATPLATWRGRRDARGEDTRPQAAAAPP